MIYSKDKILKDINNFYENLAFRVNKVCEENLYLYPATYYTVKQFSDKLRCELCNLYLYSHSVHYINCEVNFFDKDYYWIVKIKLKGILIGEDIFFFTIYGDGRIEFERK